MNARHVLFIYCNFPLGWEKHFSRDSTQVPHCEPSGPQFERKDLSENKETLEVFKEVAPVANSLICLEASQS